MRAIDADALIKAIDGNPFTTDSVKSYIRVSVAKIPTIEAPHWTPCSKRLPEKVGKYLVTAKPTYSHSKEITKAYWSGGRWLGYCQQEILAWMPLPEVYTEVEYD